MTSQLNPKAYDVYIRYICHLQAETKSQNLSNDTQSLLIRRFIPKVGGPSPKGDRATIAEAQAGIEYLKNVSLEQLEKAPAIVETAFENGEKGRIRRARFVINKFIDQVRAWGYFDTFNQQRPKGQLEQPPFNQFHRPSGEARKDWNGHSKHPRNRYDRPKKKPYALMAMKAVNTRGDKRTEKVFPSDYINDILEKELQKFKKYRGAKAKATIEGELAKIMQILGWLTHFRGISLEALRLSSIITYSKLLVKLSDVIPSQNETEEITLKTLSKAEPQIITYFLLQGFLLKENAEVAAQKDIAQLKEYFDWLEVVPISKASYVSAVLSVAYFTYEKVIGKEPYQDANDIPIIRDLLSLKRDYEKDSENHPESVPFHLKSIPWESCLGVVEKLRLRYEEKFSISRSKRYKCGFEKKKRTTYALARDLQDFLSIAFMVLIPPDRSRTYYELEVGKTFLYGKAEGRSFIPAEKLSDPSTAEWYIFLTSLDYKTGKRYGLYTGRLENTKFSDGKTLYMYIDEWLQWGRESHKPVKHEYFFRGTSECDPLNRSDWNTRITDLFERETGVGVPPKEIRKIYISYLKSQKASRAELEAARVAQHHSQKMQDSVYDYQEQLDKLQPIFDFNEKVIDRVLRGEKRDRSIETGLLKDDC